MKKVINGKVYNTEKATEVANFQNGVMPSDFDFLEETLYQSPNGQFFIAGSGGAKTKYSQPVGSNNRGGGSDIELLNESEAKDWLERHQNSIDVDVVKIFETYFPENLQEG
jgi:hypothetical protein